MSDEEALLQSKNYQDQGFLRWRLVLGDSAKKEAPLEGELAIMDDALEKLYGDEGDGAGDNRAGGLGRSTPKVARWLGDIRTYFPSSCVQIMQKDAIEKYQLTHLLLEPEILETLEPDVHLLADVITLGQMVPDETKHSARQVVDKIVKELLKRLEEPMRQAVRGAIHRNTRTRRPRGNDVDWPATIRANLKNYQQEYQSIIPEVLLGYGRKSQATHQEIILCIDQSGSMASSVVYSSIFAAVLASIPAVSTKMVLFDTQVIDVTEQLHDPVDLLFGVQLGGGTDINAAVKYCGRYLASPAKTTMVLVTDLYEGGDRQQLIARIKNIKEGGCNVIVLLALNDEGAPFYDAKLAQTIRHFDVPVFACTPDAFPGLMAKAIQRQAIDVAEYTTQS